MKRSFVKKVALSVAMVMLVFGFVPRVDAGFSPTVTPSVADRNGDLAQIQVLLEKKMVSDRLEKLGFTAGEIQSRLDGLNDAQLHQLAQNLDDLRAGGDGVGIVIALLVIAILVVVLIQLTGHKVVVK